MVLVQLNTVTALFQIVEACAFLVASSISALIKNKKLID